jgi:phosphoenolpyruvate carboxykinase (GTP)
MRPFLGYHLADHAAHWRAVGRRLGRAAPRIFAVNWFRRGPDGRFLWPGFGDNARVLDWIIARCERRAAAEPGPAGLVPAPGALDTSGLGLDPAALRELLRVDPEAWRGELADRAAFVREFATR